MRKIVIPFFLVCSFLTGCKEEEKPDVRYGVYLAESVTTLIPIDFTNSGQQTIEHIDNISTCGGSDFSIYWRLNKLTPVMGFHTFMFVERENEITKKKAIIRGYGFTQRIVDLKDNGSLDLRFYGGEGGFSNDPKQFLDQFEVKSLEYFPDEKSIRLVTQQELYDFTSEEFVETEITYLFKHEWPVN